ncbi:MAG: hypothetical protein H6835_11535 [Planctomycetes bacterium]|nr:hypothetical protein [Planctomycetota bacterium]
MKNTLSLATAVAAALACTDIVQAQSNERGSGYDAALTNVYSATDWGRRGAAYPGGEVGVSFANQLCNPGTMPVEWRQPMQPDHPKFGFLVAKEADGRLIQISDWSYCKHAFYALASPSTCGGTCQPPAVAGTQLGVHCSDIYSNGNNGSRTYLGPPVEINPWLGTWNPVGSYFDIGDPAQSGFPAPADGVRSLSTSGMDAVKNRVTIREADIPQGQNMFFQIQVVIEGERVENRDNNTMTNTFAMTYQGGSGTSAWSTSTTGTAQYGTMLDRWTGATVTSGSNGGTGTLSDFDGRFYVGVKVTGPTDGMWHYEYAVHNLDNHRGGASFRIPVCPSARVENLGFRDIDQDGANDWSVSFSGGEVAFLAGVDNPLNWNSLYNFWFDCDVAPVAGDTVVDQARPGAGSSSVTVATTVPGLQPAVFLGAGCGTPTTELQSNALPTAGNANFALDIAGGANTFVLVMFSTAAAPSALGPCTVHLDLNLYGQVGLFQTDGAGAAQIPLPVNAGQTPADLVFQGAAFNPSPLLFGLFDLTNGTRVRFAGNGCD